MVFIVDLVGNLAADGVLVLSWVWWGIWQRMGYWFYHGFGGEFGSGWGIGFSISN
jgi:hypothetical protein